MVVHVNGLHGLHGVKAQNDAVGNWFGTSRQARPRSSGCERDTELRGDFCHGNDIRSSARSDYGARHARLGVKRLVVEIIRIDGVARANLVVPEDVAESGENVGH